MSMERALFEKLKSAAGTSVGVGTTLDPKRIYAMRAPQNAKEPFIIYQRVSSERWRHLQGPSGMVQAMMQIDFYHATYNGARDLALAMEAALDGFRGTVAYGGDSPQATVRFGDISCQNDVDIFDQTDAPFLYRVSADYLITYEQS